MKAYVITVQLLIVSDTLPEAHDATRSILSDYEMADGTLKDWAYIRGGDGKILMGLPIKITEDYQEGDFLDG